MAVETKWGVGLMAEEVRAEATGGGDKYHLADALAARSGAAGVGQLDALLLSPVEDVHPEFFTRWRSAILGFVFFFLSARKYARCAAVARQASAASASSSLLAYAVSQSHDAVYAGFLRTAAAHTRQLLLSSHPPATRLSAAARGRLDGV